jgi:Caspase domain
MPKIVALLVGINEYTAVSALHGCVGDVQAIEKLLRERVSASVLDVRVLHDAAATRAGIISGFREHLTKARADDIAFFYYCGHGSQEPCPPEWLMLEPSGKNQTIVPVDARVGEVFDLADKELVALISEVAANGAQVVTMFDSCNSGGVTRDVVDTDNPASGVPRMAEASKGRTRTTADYLEAARTLFDPARIATNGPPAPAHLAISACQHDQTAKEFPKHPLPRRGAFTQALEESLTMLGPSATYVDLVTAIRTKVRDRASDQIPNLYVSGGAQASTVFLGGHVGRRDLTVTADDTGVWWLSAGVVDGIPSAADGQVTELAVYERSAIESGAMAQEPAARASVETALEDRASLRLTTRDPLDVKRAYIGVITRLATPAMHLIVTGDASDVVARVKSKLTAWSLEYAVVAAPTAGTPCVTVKLDATGAVIIGADGTPLPNVHHDLTDEGVNALSASCAHLARWYGMRDRTPIGSSLNDAVVIELVPVAPNETILPPDRTPIAPKDGAITLSYAAAQPPRVQFRLRNSSTDRLYVTLLDLDDSFGCGVLFNDWIPAGKTAFTNGGKANKLTIASWRDASYRVSTDELKVFAALSDFDASRLKLPSLLSPKGAGERLVVEEEDASFWGTSRLTLRVQRE